MSRTVIVGLAVLALAAATACASDDRLASSPEVASSMHASAGATDEDRIRELLKQEEAAFTAWDFEKTLELRCSKYREETRADLDGVVPPIGKFGTAEKLAVADPANLVAVLKKRFLNASDSSLGRVADALIRYDEPAYRDAVLQLLRETVRVTIDRVENIAVTGDRATAVVTSTTTFPDRAPETKTEPNVFVREDSQWKDCTPPTD